MNSEIIVAIITGTFSLAGYIFGNYLSQSKTLYRIAQLEKKQDKHNTLIERMYKVEDKVNILDEKIKVANNRIKDLEGEVKNEN